MSVYTLCLMAAGVLTAGNVLSRILREGLEARELIERVPPVRIADGTTGWVRVSGQVRPLTRSFRAPWSGREAVFFELRVGSSLDSAAESLRGRQRRVSAVAFEIDDGTGRALVRIPAVEPGAGGEPSEVLTALPASKRSRHWGLVATATELRRVMVRFGLREPGGLPFTAVERIIAPGDPLTIAGFATLEPNPAGESQSFRAVPTLMVFEATPDHALALASPQVLASWWGA